MSAIPAEFLTSAVEDRAIEVLTVPTDRGQNRTPSVPGLVMAAITELAECRRRRDAALISAKAPHRPRD
jgi:hypothetical protein